MGALQTSIFGRKGTATFLEAAVNYMEAGGERKYLKRLLEVIAATPLAQISQDTIDRTAKLLYPNAAPATLNRQVYTPISAVLKFSALRGLCEHRPIQRPSQSRGRVRWITPAEAERLIAASAPHLRPLVIFLLYTGARTSEALYLDWRQVDLGRAQVHFDKTKNGDARGVPLHPRVIDALNGLGWRDQQVFRRPDGRAYALKSEGGGQIKTAFRGACRRAGILNFSPHDCRHTWATWHYAANRDLPGLMVLGGWKSEKMVLRNVHVNVGHLAHSIAALPWGNTGDPCD
jgi:integrase